MMSVNIKGGERLVWKGLFTVDTQMWFHLKMQPSDAFLPTVHTEMVETLTRFHKKKRTHLKRKSYSSSRELTNRRLSHDDAVGSPYSPASSSCRNLNLRFAVNTTTFMRDQQLFSPFLKFVFIFWQDELFKLKWLTSEKQELESQTLMEATL